MARDRTVAAAVGLASLVVAALVLLSPTVERLVPTEALVEALGNDYLLVAGVAAAGAVGLFGVLFLRTVSGVAESDPPDVETVAPETAGRDLDAALASLPAVRTTARHREIYRRLRTAARETVAEYDQCPPPEASDRLAAGTWTDDERAAAFLADEQLSPPPLPVRLRERLRGRHWFRRRTRAAVAAIESLAEGPA